jgi:hypothetical protein
MEETEIFETDGWLHAVRTACTGGGILHLWGEGGGGKQRYISSLFFPTYPLRSVVSHKNTL